MLVQKICLVCLCIAVIIPEAVSWVVVKAVNTTAVKVTWSASNNADYYRVMCDSCDVNVSSSETAIVIGQLEPGTNYTISVVACRSLCSDLVNSAKAASMVACPSLCSDGINGTNNTCKSLCHSVSIVSLVRTVLHRELPNSRFHCHDICCEIGHHP